MSVVLLLRKSIAFGRCRVTALAQNRLFSVSDSNRKQSFTVSYLINSLGFSPESALSASRYVKFYSPEKPDKAIELLKGYSFTHSQISALFRRSPSILAFDAETIILPKLEFLVSKGISGPEIAKSLSLYPTVLTCSLAKQIMPAYEFFRDLFRSDKMTNAAVVRCPDILRYDIENHLLPNIYTLRQHRVPDSKIVAFFYNWPRIMATNSVQFREMVKEVVDMGFNPSKIGFVLAVCAMHGELKWNDKANVYKKWGWSEQELLGAFRKCPWCMLTSENKITKVMSFLIDKMGFQPCDVAKMPSLVTYSLEKRIIPRVEFYNVLLSRGLLEREISLSTLVMVTEKKFLQKFVTPFADEAPELLVLYKEKLALSCLPCSGKV